MMLTMNEVHYFVDDVTRRLAAYERFSLMALRPDEQELAVQVVADYLRPGSALYGDTAVASLIDLFAARGCALIH